MLYSLLVAEGFINGLRRQTSLTKLAQVGVARHSIHMIPHSLSIIYSYALQVAQSELRNSNSLNQLRQDWEGMDFQSVYAQTLYSIQPMKIPVKYSNLLPSCTLLYKEGGVAMTIIILLHSSTEV